MQVVIMSLLRGEGKYEDLCLDSSSLSELRGDQWIIEDVKEESIIVRHRYKKEKLEIPEMSVLPAFRRITDRRSMDVSDLDEYVVYDIFVNSEGFLNLIEKEIDWKKWGSYAKGRASNLIFATRFNIAAPGTCLLSYFSEKKRSWSRAGTSLHGLEDKEAKILCLWLNSTLNILQTLMMRTETEGGWMQIHKYSLKNFDVLDPSSISRKDTKELLKIFEKTKNQENQDFTSIWKQFAMNCERNSFSEGEIEEFDEIFEGFSKFLGNGFEPRKKMDMAILQVLGIENREETLKELYLGVMKEIATLKKVMG